MGKDKVHVAYITKVLRHCDFKVCRIEDYLVTYKDVDIKIEDVVGAVCTTYSNALYHRLFCYLENGHTVYNEALPGAVIGVRINL